MARVHTVPKSRKSPGTCRRCHKEIPKGEGYRYAQPGFRNRTKLIHCLTCPFRQSELTTSKMSAVYAAQENVEDAVAAWDGEDAEDVAEALREAASEIHEVAEEYGEAAEAMQSAGEEMQEKADELEGWADEIESAADDLPDKPEIDETEDTGHDFEPNVEGDAALCKHCGKLGTDKTVHHAEGEQPAEAETVEDWRQEVKDAALEAVGNCPV